VEEYWDSSETYVITNLLQGNKFNLFLFFTKCGLHEEPYQNVTYFYKISDKSRLWDGSGILTGRSRQTTQEVNGDRKKLRTVELHHFHPSPNIIATMSRGIMYQVFAL
jgi:hypothetical protein